MTEMLIKLTSFERDELRKLARKNGCHPRDQVRHILRTVLLGETPPAVIANNEKSAAYASTGNGALVPTNR